MTQFYTDFSENAIATDVFPEGFTNLNDDFYTSRVISDAVLPSVGGRYFYAQTSPFGFHVLAFDAVPPVADVEVTAKIATDRLSTNRQSHHGISTRFGYNSETHWGWYFHHSEALNGRWKATRRLSTGTTSNFGEFYASEGMAEYESAGITEWWWQRVRVVGDNHKMRVWKDGDPEPATWHMDFNDTSAAKLSAPGFAGINFLYPGYNGYFDFVGVGTGGDEAPTGPISGVGSVFRTPSGYLRTASGILRPA